MSVSSSRGGPTCTARGGVPACFGDGCGDGFGEALERCHREQEGDRDCDRAVSAVADIARARPTWPATRAAAFLHARSPGATRCAPRRGSAAACPAPTSALRASPNGAATAVLQRTNLGFQGGGKRREEENRHRSATRCSSHAPGVGAGGSAAAIDAGGPGARVQVCAPAAQCPRCGPLAPCVSV
jgi:hypothetical protein